MDCAENGVPIDTSPDPAHFSPEDVITRDVCIVGGGSSGTFTATRLRDLKKSIVLVEPKNRSVDTRRHTRIQLQVSLSMSA